MVKTPIKTVKEKKLLNLRKGGFEIKQPTPEQKKAWWERRKQAQIIMDKLLSMESMRLVDIVLQMHNKELPIGDLILYRYMGKVVADDKFMIDWLNRHIGYAKSDDSLYIEKDTSIKELSISADKLTTKELSERIKYLLKQW